jgi:alpha-1,3-glucan synthase
MIHLSGRNWSYLWNNKGVPAWTIVVMIVIFFVGIWGLLMGILIRKCPLRVFDSSLLMGTIGYAKVHSWLLPVFAVGLGCPRWCQMYWGTSGIAYYIPWGGDAGPYMYVS